MSLPLKEVRPFIAPDAHGKLAAMAEYKDIPIAVFAARLLEKAIAGEWHEVSILLERSERAGKLWKNLESKNGGGQ